MDKQTITRFLIVCGGSGVNLLGQLRLLGFSAELQIDATSEISDTKGETRRFTIRLDEIGSVADLLDQTLARVRPEPDEASSVYLHQYISHPADINHLQFLEDHWEGNVNLSKGLAQTPAIGGAAIKHPLNRERLRNTLCQMIAQAGVTPGPNSPLEFWIVSSTAGGTGEGIHRFVGVMVAEVARHTYPSTTAAINFIRIGSMTYTTVNREKTALNTLFGIAADAAMEKQFKDAFPRAVLNWYYLDLPDVGVNEPSKKARAEMIEMAGKAIMLPELVEDLSRLLVNNSGSHVVALRTGFWGRDFDAHAKYYETLRQVVAKLRILIEPGSERFFRKDQPQADFNEKDWALTWNPSIQQNLTKPGFLQARIEDDWEFPRYQEIDLLDEEKRRKWVEQFKSSIQSLIGQTIDELPAPLIFEKSKTEEPTDSSTQTPPVIPEASGEDMFGKIDEAHRHRAWCLKLLGTGATNLQASGLLKDLHEQAFKCSRAMHPPIWSMLGASSESKARDLSKHLWDFLRTLVRVNTLMGMDIGARKILDLQLSRPRTVLEYAQKELDRMQGAVENLPPCPVTAADLSKTLDRLSGKSWFRLLEQAVQEDDRRLFRTEVLKGATGLTLPGLRSVLGLQPTADPAVIRNALNSKMGRMLTPDGKEYDAPWWQNCSPSFTAQYNYRILPELEPGVEEKLRVFSGQDGAPTYIFTKLGVTGLYIFAFHAVSLNTLPGPDTTSAYVYLIRPIADIVQDFIRGWKTDPATGRAGAFEIACAGVIGDPLDERVLREGGFANQIQQISECYQLRATSKSMSPTTAPSIQPATP